MSRMVKIATTSLLIDDKSRTPGIDVDRAVDLAEAAGKEGADIVVLPELFDVYSIGRNDWLKYYGEEIPGEGPLQTRFSAIAKKYNMYVVIDIIETNGDKLHNTAVLYNRDGSYNGKYRKTHLAPGEEDVITAGDDYPVFQTDFGKVAMTICMDIHFPELFRILALQGADIILHPTMWLDYTGAYCDVCACARAIDNGIYMVTSHYVNVPFLAGRAMGHAVVIDPMGRVLADTGHRPGITTATVDLDDIYEYWAGGGTELKKRYPTLKDCYFKIRRPETYGILTRPDEENEWKIENPVLYQP